MPLSRTITINDNNALQMLEGFADRVESGHQVRGQVLARDENGKITQIRLYTRKNNLANAVTTEGRGKKFQDAREGINAILSQHADGKYNNHLNMLEENSSKLLGSRLKAAVSKNQVLVNTKTTAANLHKLSSSAEGSHQMRGIDNKDGTYILYSKDTTRQFGRSGKYTAFDRGVNQVFSNMKQQDPKLGDVMESLYAKKAAKADNSNVLKGRQFNSGIRNVKIEAYKQAANQLGIQLEGRLPEIQAYLLDRLNNEKLEKDPMRENLGMDEVYAAMKKIEAGRMNECTSAELIKAVQFIYKANPAMPLGALTALANSDHALNAAGPYTGKNTVGSKPVPFDSAQAQPDSMRQAAASLHQAVNEQLTPQQKATLRARVEFTDQLARVYDEQLGSCGKADEEGDNVALWVKSFTVNTGMQTGYDADQLVPEMGGPLLQDLSAAKKELPDKQQLQDMVGRLRDFAQNKPEEDTLNEMIDQLSQELDRPQLNENAIKNVLIQLESAVRRHAGIVPRDLMTALILHKDMIFPSHDRLNELDNQIAAIEGQIDDLHADQEKAVTSTEDDQLQEKIYKLQLQNYELVKQQLAVQTALRNEATYLSQDWDQKEVLDLLTEKDDLERNISEARQEHRWDDAIRDLAKLDKLVAEHKDKLDQANQYNLPTTRLDPAIRARIDRHQNENIIYKAMGDGGLN